MGDLELEVEAVEVFAPAGVARFQRLAELLRGARADPAARWTRNTRRAARRIALKGGR